jgi:hypothetical protein
VHYLAKKTLCPYLSNLEKDVKAGHNMGIGAPFLDKEDTCKLDFASAVDA